MVTGYKKEENTMNGIKILKGILKYARQQLRPRTVILAVIVAFGTGPVFALSPVDPVTGATPWTPQPEADQLHPGLAVTYSYGRQVHVDDIEVLRNPVIGKPLENIAHRTIDGNVLTSTQAMMVAAHIRGLIRFEAAGTYVFRIESNDGVKAKVGGRQIWVDPEIHPNRWSAPIPVVIDVPGWYEMWINYYQKKGTSALQLVWTTPDSIEETHVPAGAFSHLETQVGQ
jgi:RNase P/RNase MRP subunit p29